MPIPTIVAHVPSGPSWILAQILPARQIFLHTAQKHCFTPKHMCQDRPFLSHFDTSRPQFFASVQFVVCCIFNKLLNHLQ